MTLNVAQYLAPLNSGQVLNGYTQGVKQGVGIAIAPDGTISLDPTGASALGFLTSSVIPAPVYAWPATGSVAPANGFLQNDGLGNLVWSTDYVSTLPTGGTFPQSGAAVMPVGVTALRPAATTKGLLRYNDSTGAFEFSNGTSWLPMTPATGGLFSFVSNVTPTANAPGDLWLDTNTNQEKVWDGTIWVPTTPLATTTVPGRVQIGSNIQIAPDGTISVLPTIGVAGLVSNLGLTTITDNVTSSSIDSALSANQGRLLQQQINALVIANNLTLAGLISGVTATMTYVTPEGLAVGFTLGGPLPIAASTNDEYFVIVESAGSITPPGGVFTVVTQGDWFLSTGTSWQFLNVGYDPPIASTTQFGLTRLATNAETVAGVSNAIAVTPAGLSSRVASETLTGLTEIATQAEANAGTNDFAYLTPLKLFGVLSSGAIDANDILLSPTINGNTNVQSALNDALYNIVSPDTSVTVTETAVGQISLIVTQATETQIGGAEVATQIETNAGTDDLRIVTPLKLSQFVASGQITAPEIPLSPTINGQTNVQQALEDAIYNIVSGNNSISVAETATGQTDIRVVQATETQLGGAEVATNAETQALASDDVFVTPLKLGNLFASGSIDANDILLNPSINGNINVQAALQDTIYDVTSANASLTVAIAPTGLVTLTSETATTTLAGVVELSTVAEVLAGTNTTTATTPDGVRQATVYKSDFNAKGDILSASANDIPAILTVGTNGQYLRADSTQITGLIWDTVQASDITVSPAINGNTNLDTILRDAIYDVTSANTSITVAIAATGLVTLTAVDSTTAQKGVVELATVTEVLSGTSTTLVTTPDGVRQATVYKSDFNAKGDILSASANDIPVILAVGTDGQYLKADSTQSTGLVWDSLNANDIAVSPAINGNINLQTVLEDAVYDLNSANNSITITETATGINDIVVAQASETQLGGGEIATQAETNAGLSDSLLITPLKLAGYISSGQIEASEIALNPTINGNANVQSALQDAIYDVTSANTSLTVSIAATGLVTLTSVAATDSLAGVVELATPAEVVTGTSTTLAVTPDGVRTATVYKSDFNAKGDILSASANDTPLIVPVGTDGQFLKADSTQPSGLVWGGINAGSIVVSPAINGNTNLQTLLQDAVYDLNSANNSITITETATGINDIIVAQATETLIAGAEIATQIETQAGTDDLRMVTPLKMRTAAVYKSDFNAKGDILSASANDTPLILPVGTNAQYLVADNTTPTGLSWYSLPTTVGVAGLVSNLGLTTITDNVTSTSIDSALSANQGKLLQDQIDALVITSNLTFAGTLNSAGVVTYATTEGLAAGFTVGATLPVASAGNAEYFVICEQPGTITPPGGVATVVTQGDWFVSTGAAWQFLNVGFDVAYATTTQAGIVELATDAETQTGTDTLRVLTPSNLTSRTATEIRTGIAELATQVETEAGTDDTRIVTPLKLRTAAVYKSDFNAKGDLLSATANDTPSLLPVGTAGQVLTVDLTTPTGLRWSTPAVAAFYNLDDISASFDGTATSFPLAIGGVAYTPVPVSNIMVFIGGVAQTPGAGGAYTITGSTISFTSAPPSGAAFYATTVK